MNRAQPENAKVDREVFLKEFAAIGAAAMSQKYGVRVRTIYSRRRRLEKCLALY
jgi:hypothetical protein